MLGGKDIREYALVKLELFSATQIRGRIYCTLFILDENSKAISDKVLEAQGSGNSLLKIYWKCWPFNPWSALKIPIYIISKKSLQMRTSNTERTQQQKGQEGKRQTHIHLKLSNTKTSLSSLSGSHWARTQGKADLYSHQYSSSHGLRPRIWEVAEVQQNLNSPI